MDLRMPFSLELYFVDRGALTLGEAYPTRILHRMLRPTTRGAGLRAHADASGKVVEDGEAPCMFQPNNNIVRLMHTSVVVVPKGGQDTQDTGHA